MGTLFSSIIVPFSINQFFYRQVQMIYIFTFMNIKIILLESSINSSFRV